MMMFLAVTGGAFWAIIGCVLIWGIGRVLFDGYRAATLVVFFSKGHKKKNGKYWFKGIPRLFFRYWGRLLGTQLNCITISTDTGCWYEHNNWKLY